MPGTYYQYQFPQFTKIDEAKELKQERTDVCSIILPQPLCFLSFSPVSSPALRSS